MKKTTYVSLLVLVIGGAFLAGAWYSGQGTATPAAASARRVLYYVDPMHPAYKSDKPGIAPDCGMELVPVYEDGGMGGAGSSAAGPPGTLNVNPERQQLLGVRMRLVAKAASTHALRILGRVVPDESRVYRINAGVEGFIREVSAVRTGSRVKEGELLATFSAPESIAAFQQYIVALNSVDRLRRDGDEGGAKKTAASSNFQQRLERLRNLGVTGLQIEEINRTREVPESIKILAPADGFVLGRNISPGLTFDRGAEFYRIADLRQVSILADVFEHEAHHLRPGLHAQVSLPSQQKFFHASVAEVLPQFDPATRTLKVLLEADNPGFVLRPDMFVDVELPIDLPPTIAVPADAIVDSGLKKTVFVDRGEGLFEPRQVETGERFGDRVEIVKGLSEGERIVVSGTFLLDSESRMKLAAAAASGAGVHAGHDHGIHEQGAHVAKAMAVSAVAQAFAATPTDPICGMEVGAGKAKLAGRVSEYGGQSYYFCSDECKQRFDKDPARYVVTAAQKTGIGHGPHKHGGHQ